MQDYKKSASSHKKVADLNPNGDVDFPGNFISLCATSIEDVKQYVLSSNSPYIAFDIETTTLDPSVPNGIIGYSLSVDPYSSIYVPMRHQIGVNVDPEKAIRLVERLTEKRIFIVYNSSFDLMFLKYLGIDVFSMRFIDAMIYFYLYDPDYKYNSLKNAARSLLGRDVPTYKETLGKKKDLSFYDPSDVKFYVNCDAANTFAVYLVLKAFFEDKAQTNKFLSKIHEILDLDHQLAKVMLFYLDQFVTIDSTYMEGLRKAAEDRILQLEAEIIVSNDGVAFNFDSRKQLSKFLIGKGIDTGYKTEKTGAMKTSLDVLERVDHPLTKILVERNSLFKRKSMYLDKLSTYDEIKIQYATCRAPTGRLISGSGKENTFYAPLNFQNLTKAKTGYFMVAKKGDPGVSFQRGCSNNNGFYIVGDYQFTEVDKEFTKQNNDLRFVEGYASVNNVRKAVTVPKNDRDEWCFVSIDYDSQELKLESLLSREPIHLEAFKKGLDLHTETAYALFGKENYDSEKRKLAKVANFSLLYGSSVNTFMKVAQLDEGVAKDLYTKFWGTLRTLKNWIQREQAKCISNGGYYANIFGRPRALASLVYSEDYGLQSYGKRSVISHAIQGTCGDIMRITLIKLYNHLFSREEVSKHVRFVGTIHDELLFSIKKDSLDRVLLKILDFMTFKLEGWDFPLTVSCSIGYSYGELFPFSYEEGKIIPKYL